MGILLFILKLAVTVFLVLLAILLLAILLVLFVPFRYSLDGSVHDPEGSEEILHLDPKRDITFSGDLRWLLGAFHAAVSYDGDHHIELRVLGRPLSLQKLLGRKKKEPAKEAGEKEEEKAADERIRKIFSRLDKLWKRVWDAIDALDTDYGIRARQMIVRRMIPSLRSCLPSEWGLTGVVGLGDPARSAGVFSLQGFLYPVIAGHVAVGTEFDLYRYDLQGGARGSIRLYHFPVAGIMILLNKDFRRLFRRLRKGPAGTRKGNKGDRGNGHAVGNKNGERTAA